MKWIRYTYCIPTNTGTESEPVWEDQLFEKALPYSEEALAIAEEEAYRNEYTVEDDGMAEPTAL